MDQFKALKKRSIYLPVILSQVLMFFQQFTIFYMIYTFDVTSHSREPKFPLLILIVVGLLHTLATFACAVLVDFLGRKILLVVSGSGIVICSAGLSIIGLFTYCTETAPCGWGYTFVLLIVMLSSLGWGPIPWLMMSELVPLQVRGLANAAATHLSWLLALFLTIIFQNMEVVIMSEFYLWPFSLIMLCSIIFVMFMVPETKRCKLEEIEEHFKKGRVCYNPCKSMVQHSHRRERCAGIELCV